MSKKKGNVTESREQGLGLNDLQWAEKLGGERMKKSECAKKKKQEEDIKSAKKS